MTTVTMTKTIPTSGIGYTLGSSSSGDVTVSGSGSSRTVTFNLNLFADKIIFNSKKNMIKIPIPKTTYLIPSQSTVVDLNRNEEDIVITIYLDNDSIFTAEQKMWILRAFEANGGPCSSFVWGSTTIDGSDTSVTKAFIERTTFEVMESSEDAATGSTTTGTGEPRIKGTIGLYLGTDRKS